MAEFLSPKSVAEMFDVSLTTVNRWEKRGVIKPVQIAGVKRYNIAGLLQAASGALDEKAGGRARSATDPDEALRRAQDAAREGRQAHAGRRQR